jgi:hypothetical protein
MTPAWKYEAEDMFGALIGNTLVYFHDRNHVSESSWQELIRFYETHSDDLPNMRAIAFSDGGGPSAAQRQIMKDRFGDKIVKMRAAVVSESQFTRFIVAALTFFNAYIKFFDPSEVHKAFAHLKVPRDEEEAIVHLIRDHAGVRFRCTQRTKQWLAQQQKRD